MRKSKSPGDARLLGGLVTNDEAALLALEKWLRSLDFSVRCLVESIQKCTYAERLTNRKQALAFAELRDAAKKLTDQLIEGEARLVVIAEHLATRMYDEMHALMNPLIAMRLADWPTIWASETDKLIAGLKGLKIEGRHIAEVTVTAIEELRRRRADEELPVEPPDGKATDTKRRRKRGRPVKTDVKKDKQIYDAWMTKQHKSHKDLARAFDMPTKEIDRALRRQRWQIKKSHGASKKDGR